MLALLMLCISSFSLMPMNPIYTLLLMPNRPCQLVEDAITTQKDSCKSEAQKSMLESVLSLNDDNKSSIYAEEPCSTVTPDMIEALVQIDIIRQPSPPLVLVDVHDLVPIASTQVTDLTSGPEKLLQDELVHTESPLQLHIVRFCGLLRLRTSLIPSSQVDLLQMGNDALGYLGSYWDKVTEAYGVCSEDK
ncbi:hypothetical protein AAC387_Pa12g1185 [Persea americana]